MESYRGPLLIVPLIRILGIGQGDVDGKAPFQGNIFSHLLSLIQQASSCMGCPLQGIGDVYAEPRMPDDVVRDLKMP